MKIRGKKLKMLQTWKNNVAMGATPILLATAEDAKQFTVGERVKVTAISKGKGFQGVVKRHGFHGGPKTHGQKNRHRAPGSIGNTTPQRVIPGRRMAGRMGGVRVAVKNLEVVALDAEKRILMVNGATPGPRNAAVTIEK